LPLLRGENYLCSICNFYNQVACFLVLCYWFCYFITYPFLVFSNCMYNSSKKNYPLRVWVYIWIIKLDFLAELRHNLGFVLFVFNLIASL
jgi:hypothetical protein